MGWRLVFGILQREGQRSGHDDSRGGRGVLLEDRNLPTDSQDRQRSLVPTTVKERLGLFTLYP